MGYLDWAVWQRAFLDEVVDGDKTRMNCQLAYWRETLDDAPVLEMPCDHVRPAVFSTRGANAAVQGSEYVGSDDGGVDEACISVSTLEIMEEIEMRLAMLLMELDEQLHCLEYLFEP